MTVERLGGGWIEAHALDLAQEDRFALDDVAPGAKPPAGAVAARPGPPARIL